jgi:hypothetical protein
MSWALGLWLVLQGATVLGVAHYLRHVPADRQEEAPDGVAVLLCVKDDWDGGPDLMKRLAAQNVPFRLIVATSGACPAAEELDFRDVQIVRAGVAHDEGQKVHKLRAALRALKPDDRYLVLIDADIEPPARLIGRLLFPLVRDKADIVTGYRLLLPDARPLLTLVGAVEMQLATLPRAASSTMPWGGAMAMTRPMAEQLELDRVLAGRLSDDMTIGLAGWHEKLRLRPVRDLLVASPLEGSGRTALSFAIRQYRHVITSSPGMWWIAALVVSVQSLGWLWVLGWGGWSAMGVGYGAAWCRAMIRMRIIASVIEPDQTRKARRSLIWDAVAPFIVTWTHLTIQVVGALSRRIRWGGYDYWVKQGKVVRIEKIHTRSV